jgi:hypothetical protein
MPPETEMTYALADRVMAAAKQGPSRSGVGRAVYGCDRALARTKEENSSSACFRRNQRVLQPRPHIQASCALPED